MTKNLITNAIKFTRLEDTRQIVVSLGLAVELPLCNTDGKVQFIRTSEASEAQTLQLDWEKGELVCLFSGILVQTLLLTRERSMLFSRCKTQAGA